MKVQVWSQIVEANGKTIRENNLDIQHKIPLGSIVTVEFDETLDSILGIGYRGKATLYVTQHTRDCDGTPLYSLSSSPVVSVSSRDQNFLRWKFIVRFSLNGYSEDSLHDTGNKAEVFYNDFQDYLSLFM